MASSKAEPQELVIRAATTLSADDFREIWRSRELILILGLRDVRVRYSQAIFGALWAILQPGIQALVFTLLFHRLAGIRGDVAAPYPLFCLAGLVVWTLFATGLGHASDSLVANSNLITKAYFPRAILPLAAQVVPLVDFAVSFTILVILSAAYGIGIQPRILFAVPVALLGTSWAIAIGLWTAAVNVQFRDVRHALPFFIQVFLFLTPVFYSSSLLPAGARPFYELNPIAAVVDGFRAALFGGDLPVERLALSLAGAAAVTLLGFAYFRRMERSFADRI